jgi:hypothetical protein
MEKMMVTITAPQVAWLRERATGLDISVSELVRRVLDQERERVGERARAMQPRDEASETAGATMDSVADDGEDGDDMEDKELSLTRAMLELYNIVGRETGYWANRYLQAVRRKGGLACAKALLARPRSHGLERLMAEGRIDLSVEALVLDPRYADLFSPEERAIASTRLEAAQSGQAAN